MNFNLEFEYLLEGISEEKKIMFFWWGIKNINTLYGKYGTNVDNFSNILSAYVFFKSISKPTRIVLSTYNIYTNHSISTDNRVL